MGSFEIKRDWFKQSERLDNLFFYQNRIPRLEAGKFVDLKNLYSLNFQYNFIKEIDVDAFKGLEILDMIHLSYNEIEYLTSRSIQKHTILEKTFSRKESFKASNWVVHEA